MRASKFQDVILVQNASLLVRVGVGKRGAMTRGSQVLLFTGCSVILESFIDSEAKEAMNEAHSSLSFSRMYLSKKQREPSDVRNTAWYSLSNNYKAQNCGSHESSPPSPSIFIPNLSFGPGRPSCSACMAPLSLNDGQYKAVPVRGGHIAQISDKF